ncbi:hypothetical protein FRX31_009035 [Thalictrum thalictroides]|uniref:F-box domain-containing protein n=1 Tax=Thalictrum thalictroides TaxID=46969 RepID=A0A7J6WVE9_THATH|nr:hypothetical protein FRX31_009035 [Thalictrum thalictroides]
MRKSMEPAAQTLPEEIWINILETGIENSTLGFKDLCSLSISCKHFYKFSNEDTLWSLLLTLDFPQFQRSTSSSHYLVHCSYSKKRLYFQVMHDILSDRLVKYKYEHAVVSRKIKRIRRELKVLDQQLDELSGDLLAMVQDRHLVCHEKLACLEEAHMDYERKYLRLCVEFKSMGGKINTFSSIGVETNALEDHREAGSSEDIEDSFEDESEESAEDGSDKDEGEPEEGSYDNDED